MPPLDRRQFVHRSLIGSLAFEVGGVTLWLTPREAAAQAVPLKHFEAEQAELLGAFCEHLLPGAVVAGVVPFIDQQLSQIPNECQLLCKFFPGINPPYAGFYHAGLAALAAFSEAKFANAFTQLSAQDKDDIVGALWSGKAEPWAGPPPPLFYMMLRSDAVDVVYGTEAGFAELDIPYLAHIRPPTRWLGEKS